MSWRTRGAWVPGAVHIFKLTRTKLETAIGAAALVQNIPVVEAAIEEG